MVLQQDNRKRGGRRLKFERNEEEWDVSVD
jgi:hypothetical protein